MTNGIEATDQSPVPAGAVIVYEVDAENIITRIDVDWKVFAESNGAPELNEANVIGRPLLDFISGNVTKKFWSDLLQHVRLANSSHTFNYRCDAPNAKRYMKLDILPLPAGHLRLVSTLLHTKPRPLQIYFRRAQQRSSRSLVRCSICNKVTYNKQWVEGEELNRGIKTTLEVIYGICPVCHVNITPD